MAKKFSFKGKKGALTETVVDAAVGVGAGIGAKLLDSKVLSSQSDTVKALIKAGAGAGLAVLMPNNITKAIGQAWCGVAGYQLSSTIGISGIFGIDDAPASQRAIGASAGQSWVATRAIPSNPLRGVGAATAEVGKQTGNGAVTLG